MASALHQTTSGKMWQGDPLTNNVSSRKDNNYLAVNAKMKL